MSRWLSIFLFISMCASLGGCATPNVSADANVPMGNATISVIAHGWHTDIGLPIDEVTGPLTALQRDFPGARYLVVGLGERDFLMSRDAGVGEMLGALFPSRSAILVTALRTQPNDAFTGSEQVITLRLTPEDVKRIAALIWLSLDHDADGAPVRLADGPHIGSAFYASNETYDAFHTCNTWIALLLRNGGFPVETKNVLLSNQLIGQVTQIAALQAQRAR